MDVKVNILRTLVIVDIRLRFNRLKCDDIWTSTLIYSQVVIDVKCLQNINIVKHRS